MLQAGSKRKRSRIACEPCRERKKKCDGSKPCTTCSEWGYDCHYDSQPRPKSPATRDVSAESTPKSKSPSCPSEPTSHDLARRLEANSGAAFVRRMGLKIDPAKAPRLSLFGWNVGKRQLSAAFSGVVPSLSIIEITSLEHMQNLAQVYFEKVDPCYGFIDRHQFFERLEVRWQSSGITHLYDSVLGGVAALGCLFSQRNMTITELHLVESVRHTLDTHVLFGVPPFDLLTGWTLRVAYLRMTDSPHATWIASSSLMHLIEAAGLYIDPSPDSVFLHHNRINCDPDISRRLSGVAQHLNLWTSYDLGLSTVSFQESNIPPLPSMKPGDYTHELLRLLPVSASLEPCKSRDEDTHLEARLAEIIDGSHSEPPSTMAQCNLVLCLLRRLPPERLEIFPSLADKCLELLKRGLDGSRNMVLSCLPWHHLVNVPFHIICVLLAMDTRSSLAILPEAMQTLRLAADTYDTDTMREAWNTASLLVMLYQQRRRDDVSIFSEALGIGQHQVQAGASFQETTNAEMHSWLENLVSDLPGLNGFGIDQFLSAEVPDPVIFNGGSG